jgi:type IV pilus assembly protein PilE
MKFKKIHLDGFSLIELMVVVAIIAMLAVVAMPAYSSYVGKSKLNSAMVYLRTYLDAETQYYAQNGRYASLQELGYAGALSGTDQTPIPNSASEYAYPPYVAVFGASELSTSSYTCPGTQVFGVLSNFKDGAVTGSDFSPHMAYVFITAIQLSNGLDAKTCYYTYGPNGSQISGDYIPECQNLVDFPSAFNDTIALLNSC